MLGFVIGICVLMGLNSLALGFKVDFFTWSVTPSVRSVVSDRTSSLPGVLAGCGTAGECLSEAGDAAVAATPGTVGASLTESSMGAGEACGWEGVVAAGWGRTSEAGWLSDCESLAATGLAASPMVGGVAAAGELGELVLPPSLNSLPNFRSSSICDL